MQRREYRRKLTGPVIDRIDITRHVEPLQAHEARDPLRVDEDTMTVRARVSAARQVQAERYSGQPWRVNGQAPGARLRQHWPLTDEAANPPWTTRCSPGD